MPKKSPKAMPKIDFSEIPIWWPVCMNDSCPMAADCLRRQAAREAPASVTHWPAVLPSALSDGQCKYYQKAETVRMARGLNAIYKNVRSREAQHQIRMNLTWHFGSKGSYYRYKDGERWLGPEEQQYIIDVIRAYGGQVEVDFDEYRDTFDFTKAP